MLKFFNPLSLTRKKIGKDGEQYVGTWLKKNGYTILEYNFTVKEGEIDIIAQKAEVIAFIEVKTRTKNYFNTSEVITKNKQQKIMKAAAYYRAQHNFIDKLFRFDVALIDVALIVDDNQKAITYIPHAFCSTNP